MKKKILFSLENFKDPYSKDFIKQLANNYEVTIITSKKKFFFINKKIKIIKYRVTYIDKVINKICTLLSNVHLSKKQKIYALFQIDQTNNLFKKIILKLKFFLSKNNLLPKMDSIYCFIYNFFPINDELLSKYDFFIYDFRLFQNHNECKRIIYNAIRYKKISAISWVYSWDNIFTFSTISSSDFFIVWSNYIKKLISRIHNIDKNKILVNSPPQFKYLNKPKKIKKTKKENYILFACAYGGNETNNKDYVLDDLKMIELMTNIIKTDKINIKILVRPYPYVKYKNLITFVKKNSSIVKFDYNSYNFSKNTKNLNLHLKKKRKQIENSIAIFSFGSTFNIESSILLKPTFHLDFSDFKRNSDLYDYRNFSSNLDEFFYLKLLNSKNIIKNKHELRKILKQLSKKNSSDQFLDYSRYLISKFYEKKNNIKLII